MRNWKLYSCLMALTPLHARRFRDCFSNRRLGNSKRERWVFYLRSQSCMPSTGPPHLSSASFSEWEARFEIRRLGFPVNQLLNAPLITYKRQVNPQPAYASKLVCESGERVNMRSPYIQTHNTDAHMCFVCSCLEHSVDIGFLLWPRFFSRLISAKAFFFFGLTFL